MFKRDLPHDTTIKVTLENRAGNPKHIKLDENAAASGWLGGFEERQPRMVLLGNLWLKQINKKSTCDVITQRSCRHKYSSDKVRDSSNADPSAPQ